jgi:D-amino-acid dehydrogenase
MRFETEILIIGGGAIGICSAYYANERRSGITVVDKGEVCSGSSYGNAGFIVPSHCIPLAAPKIMFKALKYLFTPDGPVYLKPRVNLDLFDWLWKFRGACNDPKQREAMAIIRELSLASFRLFDELADRHDLEFGFKKQGYLRVYKTDSGLKAGVEEAHLLNSIGVEIKVLDGEAIRELEPSLEINVLGGVFYPEDAHLVPAHFVRGLAHCLEQQGVQIYPSTEVLDFETSGRRITRVRTTRGDFFPGEIVLAAGSWVPDIVRDLHIRLPIQAAKGYSFTFKKPAKCPNIPFSLAEAGVAVTPMGNSLRFAGTFEMAGLDLSLNRARLNTMLREVPTYLPDLEAKNLELIEIWRGLRPCTPDGLPFLGRSSMYDNLIVAAGHGMIGISLSPVTGRLVSDLLMREEPSIDLTALRVDRFDGDYDARQLPFQS